MKGICTRCHEDFMNCKCEQFHPSQCDIPIKGLFLSEDEIKALIDYFYQRAGYISPEFDPMVIAFTKRLDDYELNKRRMSGNSGISKKP